MRDRPLGATIRIYFTTHTVSTGVAVAPSSAFASTDFRVYKDGSATEKTTTNGITVTSPFDSLTGSHLIELDTSNSTGDVGFWASGSAYRVVISTAKTVDSKDPSGICVGEFSIELQTADTRKIGGTAQTAHDAGASLQALTRGLGSGVVGSSSTTTVVNLTSTQFGLSVSDQLKGRILIFNKDTTTAALRGQGAPILSSTTTSITVAAGDAFTASPASGDAFTIY
jgi:hypothetical protein